MKFTVKKITTLAMLAALAYVVMVFVRIPLMPAAPYLEYDPKDILFVMAGFLIGPVESTIIIILVCALELVTVSSSGLIGFAMNVIASLCFVLPAAFIYRIKKTQFNAILGLLVGVLSMTASMLLWNYIMTPIYMGVPREVVAGMLPTVFLPFNLIKAGINMALTLIVYKPISIVLHKSGILEEKSISTKAKLKTESATETTTEATTDTTTKEASEAADKSETASTDNIVEAKKTTKKKFSPIATLAGVLILLICIAAIFFIK
ncbi:MAG: ECF transporter S component [Lachnospiraceae bacterium]|nr:ECF transporter S component [Lachnospiraceae bacterium]